MQTLKTLTDRYKNPDRVKKRHILQYYTYYIYFTYSTLQTGYMSPSPEGFLTKYLLWTDSRHIPERPKKLRQNLINSRKPSIKIRCPDGIERNRVKRFQIWCRQIPDNVKGHQKDYRQSNIVK